MASNLKRFLASKFNIFEVSLFQSMLAPSEHLSQTWLSWCLNISFKTERPYGAWWGFVACKFGRVPGWGSIEVTFLLWPNGVTHWPGTGGDGHSSAEFAGFLDDCFCI